MSGRGRPAALGNHGRGRPALSHRLPARGRQRRRLAGPAGPPAHRRMKHGRRVMALSGAPSPSTFAYIYCV
ncbi:hypothetical protein MASSI9I_20617 [Massilia sp. 9I]|nr:hypothetical protein MASSI9I_20617 [Massilia sp. 9I]